MGEWWDWIMVIMVIVCVGALTLADIKDKGGWKE
jgi:hypothetical protein